MHRVTPPPGVTRRRSPSSLFAATALGVRLAVLALAAALAGCGDEPLRPVPRGAAGIEPALSGAASVGFTLVSAGWHYACALRTDGTMACWGYNPWGASTPAAGTFTQLGTGLYHTCAVRTDGTLHCWGYNREGQAEPPAGTFTQVSAGNFHACAVRTDGTVACWGYNGVGETRPPAGTFTQVSVGHQHSCGLKVDGTVACWGLGGNGQTSPPVGALFTQVSAFGYHTCGLKTDGAVACWGANDDGESTPPAGTFLQVAAGVNHACAVRPDGTVACWGAVGTAFGPSGVPAGLANVVQVSAGSGHTCAVKSDGTITCWRTDGAVEHIVAAQPQTIAFTSTPPQPAVLGATYAVSATGGGSGNPVVFSSRTPTVCTVAPSAGNASTVSLIALGTCTVAADQAGNAGYLDAPSVTQSFGVVYAFAGFFAPVENPGPDEDGVNQAKAGAGIAVKFNLAGDRGLAIFRAGYPRFVSEPCTTGDAGTVVDDATTSPAGLTYDADTGQYTYVWKTDKGWAGACGRFELGLVDGSDHHALFHFVR